MYGPSIGNQAWVTLVVLCKEKGDGKREMQLSWQEVLKSAPVKECRAF